MPIAIDQMWFTNLGQYLFRKMKEDECGLPINAAAGCAVLRPSPTIVVPESAELLVRHSSSTKAGVADFSEFFSDHAIVAADFEILLD